MNVDSNSFNFIINRISEILSVAKIKYTKITVVLLSVILFKIRFQINTKMKYRYLYIISLLLFFSCSKDIDVPFPNNRIPTDEGEREKRNSKNNDILEPKGRTILVYLAGDNNLSHEVSEMHEALMEGWNPSTMGSLVIFADSRVGKPVLIKFEAGRDKIIADTLRIYTNENSASPELLNQVILDTKKVAPGESYGMVLFSHATGWLPEKAFINPTRWGAASYETPNIAPRSIFDDRGREMELADFASAIPDQMFDFMVFDMCFMSSVETAYALRNKTQYLLAAAPEILSPGFTPVYKTSLGLLYKSNADLEGFGQAFYDYFNGLQGAYQSAAISVVKTSEIEALASLTSEINPQLNQEEIDQVQFYDRNGKPHVFFDYGEYMKAAATPQQNERLEELLSKTVIFKLNTPKLININIVKHSGLSVYIPQESLPRLNEAYKKTEWWKAVRN